MTIPGVGQLTSFAFVAAIDDPSRIRRSREVGAYLGLVPRRYQSGEVDYVGSISKCGDRRVRTLLYEAANVMLTRYKGQLKLKDWAFAIAKRSTMRKARVALARRLAIIHARDDRAGAGRCRARRTALRAARLRPLHRGGVPGRLAARRLTGRSPDERGLRLIATGIAFLTGGCQSASLMAERRSRSSCRWGEVLSVHFDPRETHG
jgi:hypothetical protein